MAPQDLELPLTSLVLELVKSLLLRPGISTINITGGGGGGGGGGISTAQATVTNGNTPSLDLDNAQDHKITLHWNCNDFHYRWNRRRISYSKNYQLWHRNSRI